MSWYDELLDYQINWLSNNTTPFGLCTEWKQTVFGEILKEEPEALQVYFGEWTTNSWGTLSDRTYRLNPDWKRPEKPEKKEGHWEYCDIYTEACDIYTEARAYRFVRSDGVDYFLDFAFSFPGFGGIEFEEKPNIWCCSLMVWSSASQLLATGVEATSEDVRPATPKRVRFWVEG